MIFRRAKNLIFICSFFSALVVFGYDNLVIHPMLSSAATEIYNGQADEKLTQKQINWIVDGAIAEDTDPRYLNHFYNPVTGLGLNDGGFSGLPAKEWVRIQASATGDYSESAILKNYQDGNYKRAYQGIGHILHLTQDMAVPAHTRNDAHPGGDPYEKWAEQYGTVNVDKINLTKIGSLDDMFNNLSSYTHNNFFSKDTVFIDDVNKYELLVDTLNNTKIKYLTKQLGGRDYRVCIVDDSSIKFICKINNDDLRLNMDYWNMLYPQAIGYSAGIIDYFERRFKEIDSQKQEKKLGLLEKAKGLLDNFVNNLKYEWGDVFLASRIRIENVWGNATSFGDTTVQNIGYFVEANKEVVNTITDKVLSASVSPESGVIKKVDSKTAPQTLGVKIVDQSAQVQSIQSPVEQTTVTQPEASITEQATNIENIVQNVELPATTTIGSSAPQTEVVPQQNVFIPTAGDSTPPETTISSFPAAVSGSSSVSFVFSSNETVGGYEYDLDGSGWRQTQSEQGFADLSDGSHVIKVRAIDAAGNIDQTPAEFSWVIDTGVPVIEIVGMPSIFASSSQADFLFSSSEDVLFECQVDFLVWQECQASTTISDISDGAHSIEVKGSDIVGNTSSSTVFSWTVDTVSPTSSISSLDSYYLTNGFDVSWNGDDVVASTTDISGFDSYDIQYKIADGDWQDWLIGTTSTSTVFEVVVTPGSLVYIQARANDKAGNASDWSIASTTIGTGHIVISEVQISGLTATDEFVELYNPTGSTINLSGYRLSRKTSTGNQYNLLTTFPDVNLPAGGFFLVTHPTNYKGSVIADAVYSTTESIAADNTVVLYSDAGTIVADKVGLGAAGDFETSATINPSANQSIERKRLSVSTAESMANGIDRWYGNSYDSEDNNFDFLLRSAPDPQNSSFLESGFSVVGEPSGTVVIGETSTAFNNWQKTFSWSHPVSGDSPVLVVSVHTDGNYVNSVSYGGINMILAADKVSSSPFNNMYVAMYYLPNPPSGLNNIEIRSNYVIPIITSAVTLYNCNTADPIDSTFSFFGGGVPEMFYDINTFSPNSLILDAIVARSPQSYYLNAGLGQTRYFHNYMDGQTNYLHSGESYKLAEQAGAQSMSWTTSVSSSVYVAVAIRPN